MEKDLNKAQSLFERSNFTEVIKICKKILESKDDSIGALKLITKSLLATNQIEDARFYLNKSTILKPNNPEIIKDLGNTYLIDGDNNTAKKYYKKSILINRSYAPALTNLGIIELKIGNKEEALSLLIKATESDPKLTSAWINLANCYIELEKIKEAEVACRKALDLDSNLFNSYLLLSNILFKEKRYNEAEESIRIAIKLRPESALAHYNLGSILETYGDPKEAIKSLKISIELNPNFADAYYNLGNILFNLGETIESESNIIRAININPNFANAHATLGRLYKNLGRERESFDSYIKAIEIDDNNSIYYSLIKNLIRDNNISELNKNNLKDILNILLRREDIPHEELFKGLKLLYKDFLKKSLEISDSDYIDDDFFESFVSEKILIKAMKKMVFKDLKWEKLLNRIRKFLLKKAIYRESNITYNQLDFIIALGHQCFLNEYVYYQDKEEEIYLKKMTDKYSDNDINDEDLALLSCYIPIYKLATNIPSIKSIKSSNEKLNQLLSLQLIEPLEELKLLNHIKKIGSISDRTSNKVKAQYEDNPYPRWRFEDKFKDVNYSARQLINSEIIPNIINSNIVSKPLKILLAGCGTGKQILHAQRYGNAEITAIDLSSASLAYAQRKINELEIQNVSLIQMDILDVSLLQEKFDIIECCGVLHHMAQPIKGLKALLEVSKPDSFLKLSFYSELSRQNVIKAREIIKNRNLNPNIDNIRTFRQDIINGKYPEIFSQTTNSNSDFYTTSVFRDLVFHCQEHRFTCKQIDEILTANKLKFLGYKVSSQIRSLYKKTFPVDRMQTSLKNWDILEREYPGIFGGTPNFWVSKNQDIQII